MDICVKYCGGCNPRYDRKKIVDKIKEDFNDINIITQRGNMICDFAVVISGCMSSCVNHDNIEGRYGKFIIKDIMEYEKLKSTLLEIVNKE
nr:hypothetical protein [Sedimentibacter sp.]